MVVDSFVVVLFDCDGGLFVEKDEGECESTDASIGQIDELLLPSFESLPAQIRSETRVFEERSYSLSGLVGNSEPLASPLAAFGRFSLDPFTTT